jgi:hypothetical protein
MSGVVPPLPYVPLLCIDYVVIMFLFSRFTLDLYVEYATMNEGFKSQITTMAALCAVFRR